MGIEKLVNSSILPKEGIQKALGLDDVPLTSKGIIQELQIVKIQYGTPDQYLIDAANKLINSLQDLGATVLSEDEAFDGGSLRKGVCAIIVSNDDYKGEELVVIKISDPRTNIMLTVLPGSGYLPITGIMEKGNLKDGKYDFFSSNDYMTIRPQQLRLFTWWMSNLAVVVDKEGNTRLLSMNGCYPEYTPDEYDILAEAVGTKLGAPVLPPERDDFSVDHYPITAAKFKPVLDDLSNFAKHYGRLELDEYVYGAVDFIKRLKDKYQNIDQSYLVAAADIFLSGPLAQDSGLWDMREDYSNLPFRTRLHHKIGKFVTSSGMADGFRAMQMPASIRVLIKYDDLNSTIGFQPQGYPIEFFYKNDLFLRLKFPSKITNEIYYSQIPEQLNTLTIPSGESKTIIQDPINGTLILGVRTEEVDGEYIRRKVMMTPMGVELSPVTRPSYDTVVINGHRFATHLMGQIIKTFKPGWDLPDLMQDFGMALAHHHGDELLHKNHPGFLSYGDDFATVSCSALQTAYYEVYGKLNSTVNAIMNNSPIIGARHREVHHGVNVDYVFFTMLLYLYKKHNAAYMGEYAHN